MLKDDLGGSGFKASKELKSFFNERYQAWRKKHHLSLGDLAQRCGVTPSYLGHVGRYGRVPGKPVLILLALNFELSDPTEIFSLAGIKDPWPFEEPVALGTQTNPHSGLLSVNLDMQGFAGVIREIVREEVRPRSVRQLTRGRPLQVGLNLMQKSFFDSAAPTDKTFSGAFPEIFRLVMLALQSEVKFSSRAYPEAVDELAQGQLDVYGPLQATSERIGKSIFTNPFCRIGMSCVWRTRAAKDLKKLAPPKSLADLISQPYEIAVLKGTGSHDFALTNIGRTEERLIVCDTPEECFERLVLSGIRRPAHLMVCDALSAAIVKNNHPNDCELLCCDKDSLLGYIDNAIAVRPDWPELARLINESLQHILRQGILKEVLQRSLAPEVLEVIDIPARI